jgi:hypothetical protein
MECEFEPAVIPFSVIVLFSTLIQRYAMLLHIREKKIHHSLSHGKVVLPFLKIDNDRNLSTSWRL